MDYEIKKEGDFKYMETNSDSDEVLLLLHGLFGALSNYEGIIQHFGKTHNVVVPMLPIFEMPIRKVSVSGLVDYVDDFVEYKDYKKVNVIGNSLGGHIALLYALARPERMASLTLTGSSGLFESALGSSFPRRSNYEFIKQKTETTFYDPAIASKELIDEVFDTVNDRGRAIRIIATAKSAVRHNLGDKLHQIKTPTLLVWGNNDVITPPFVADKFHEMLEDSRLFFVDKCGHVPMMEHPALFNQYLEDFLQEVANNKVSSEV